MLAEAHAGRGHVSMYAFLAPPVTALDLRCLGLA